MTYAIQAQGLVKRFAKTLAVDGVDLAVAPGTVLGLLGPNGAGKTTVVRMLATLLRPDAGTATVGGYDVRHDAEQVRAIIGLTGQYAAVDEDLTGFENLLLIGRLLELPTKQAKLRASELLERFELADAARRSVRTYSGGMRRRLDLAASLVATPRILFLDEPTTGLDPRSRGEVWAMVRALVADGATVLLTTQYLDEADRLANEIAVIDHGRLIASGTAAELKAKVGGQTLDVRPTDPADLDHVTRIVEAAVGTAPTRGIEDPGLLSVAVDDAQALPIVVARLQADGIPITELALRLASLDEVFLALTGHAADDASAGRPDVPAPRTTTPTGAKR
ncbi:MAG TPA: ATP-binding cassette domain-containing protein [Micromonosporaceae bacterium]|jgi:oleandomycin transport system ATP-binding protein|nr:ATP-binding cassette domain-containing protein [Micromonosporaceae bacterium]